MRTLTAIFIILAVASCAGMPGQATGERGATMAVPTAQNLLGTEWILEDLGGAGVLDRVQATLSFPEAGRVAGGGSCNRFTGSVEVGSGVIRFGQLATTRRACVPAVMDQEGKYLRALAQAERVAMEGPYLLIYSKGLEKPLRFTRKE
jgi:heat shock protein HslJ